MSRAAPGNGSATDVDVEIHSLFRGRSRVCELEMESIPMTDQIAALLEPFSSFNSQGIEAIGAWPFLVVLSLSLACGLFIAVLYRRFYSQRETGSQIQRAFPLLSLAITAIFVCIQFSLPLSLGLLGALSIVRFRTPIKEPEEIGFLMVVIATSLACATFNFKFLGIILLLAIVALVAQELLPGLLRGGSGAGIVLISVPGEVYRSKRSELLATLQRGAPKGRLESVSEDSDSVVLTYSFRGLDSAAATEFQQRLGDVVPADHVTLSYERSTAV